ncbi:sigma-70 family RNA polymerase sigma factor [Planomonospora sp. ID67723]|uniref:sigma-70 family RNA polymerase sigma factor n=1 Tax=Planomonospora sp. ID67723 TaxID=2738134 RepID=UPI0027DEA6F7|nr:sigma-70 family RNA polymerase sigma factor [Planomonospora sp. ID67723]
MAQAPAGRQSRGVHPQGAGQPARLLAAPDPQRAARRRPPEHGHSHGDSTVDRIVLRQALTRLTPRQRAVIVLRFYEDRSERETAEPLNCSLGTVKNQTCHALGRLRVLAPEPAHLFAGIETLEGNR